MDPLALGAIVVLLLALLFVLSLLVYLVARRGQTPADLATPLQNLAQAVAAGQVQTAVLAEKLSHLEPLVVHLADVQQELRALAERVSGLEGDQRALGQGLQSLGTGLAQTSTATGSLLETAAAIRSGLGELQAQARARQDLEQRTAESIRRLETVIAGTQSKGAAGENILEAVFAKLPPDWQVRNFRVGNKAVEFGLRLPNNLILPIDSKWTATALLEQFACSGDPEEQRRLKAQIEAAVLSKAREVKKYLDPNVTVGFGIAAVPDAVYDLCCGIQVDVFRENVVLVAYSMFVPYLLLVFQTSLKSSQNVDPEKLAVHLRAAQASVKALQEEVEGRMSRAITMLSNSRSDMGLHLGKVSAGLTNLQIGAGQGAESPAPPALGEAAGGFVLAADEAAGGGLDA